MRRQERSLPLLPAHASPAAAAATFGSSRIRHPSLAHAACCYGVVLFQWLLSSGIPYPFCCRSELKQVTPHWISVPLVWIEQMQISNRPTIPGSILSMVSDTDPFLSDPSYVVAVAIVKSSWHPSMPSSSARVCARSPLNFLWFMDIRNSLGKKTLLILSHPFCNVSVVVPL